MLAAGAVVLEKHTLADDDMLRPNETSDTAMGARGLF
jgi:hypothetical protein